MGNKAKNRPEVTKDQLHESVKFVMLHQGVSFTKNQLAKHLQTIMTSIQQKHPFGQGKDGILQIDNSLILMFYCSLFSKQMLKILKQFIEKLQQINKKSLLFLKSQEIIYLNTIANFILFFSNQNILTLFDSLLVRSDLSQSNKETLKEIQSREQEAQIAQNLVERLAEEQIIAVEKSLRVTISNFINLRQQALSSSEETLQLLTFLEQSLFQLYAKIYFSQPNLFSRDGYHSQGSRQKEHFRKNVIIAAYFIASGTSHIRPAVYQTAVLFLYSLINIIPNQEQQQQSAELIPSIKTLPSHLFKNLPIIPSNSLYQYILCTILFSLKYIKEGISSFIRFDFNRIQSLKVVEKMLQIFKITSQTITYYIEQLCIQVKVGQIQRACIYQISKIYLKQMNEKGENSDIMAKFVSKSDLKYNLKFSGREIKVSTNELLTELEDDEDLYIKNFSFFSEKFIYESIIFQPMQYASNDRMLWSELLPNIMLNKQDQEVTEKFQNKQEQNQQNPIKMKQQPEQSKQNPIISDDSSQKQGEQQLKKGTEEYLN